VTKGNPEKAVRLRAGQTAAGRREPADPRFAVDRWRAEIKGRIVARKHEKAFKSES
jgi:hypothetical protein